MRSRGVPARGLLLAVLALELLALFVVLRNSSWVYDDNFFLVLAGQQGFTWRWLSSVQFEHWDIAEHAAISLQHAIFFFDYRWALMVMLAILGASTLVFERVLAMFVRTRWITIAFALWFALNILWVRPLQWWAAGIQYFPYTFFELLCLYGFLRYWGGKSARWIVVSAGALAGGLLFYEKPAYMLLYLVLFRILLMSKDLRPRSVVADFWRERAIWLSYLAVIGIWAYGYVQSSAYTGAAHGAVTLDQYASYFRILWLQTLVPSLASVTIPAVGLSGVQILFVVVSQIAVVAGIGVSLRRKRAAWRAWVFLGVIVLASGILVGRSRIAQFGVTIANDPRYLIEYAWLVPLTLCAAFARSDVLSPTLRQRTARLTLAPSGRLAASLTAALFGVYALGSVVSAAHLQEKWAGPQGRIWAQRARAGIAAQQRSGQHPVVADNTTPFEIMEGFVAPYNRLSSLLGIYVGHVQVDGPLDGPLVRMHDDGTVRRAVVDTVVGSGGAVSDLLSSHALKISAGGRTVMKPGEVCVIADGQPVSVERPLSPPSATGGPYYTMLAYRAWQPAVLPLSVGAAGRPPEDPLAISIAPGTRSSIAWLGEGAPYAVTLTVAPLNTICIRRFEIVSLRDAG